MRIALSFLGCHRRGGVERVMVEAANFLQGSGHETHVFAAEWDPGVLDPDVTRHTVRTQLGNDVARIVTFTRQSTHDIARAVPRADVVGTFGVLSPPGAVVWATSIHRAWLEISRRHRNLAGRLRQRLNPVHYFLLAMERDLFKRRKYRRVVALTDQVKADLMRLYDVPADHIDVVPNGFAPAEFNLDCAREHRVAMRSSLGYAPDHRVVIFVANELERKGFGPLVRALAEIGDPRTRLLVVGRVSPDAYAAEIRRLGLGDRVRYVGASDRVATYYAAADVFALPTQYEAWGLVVVEAMACGLPVLTSRLAGAAIAVREPGTGLLLDDPRDISEIAGKLGQLLDGHHDSREEIAGSVAEYAWPRVLERYEAVLARCAAGAAPAIAVRNN
jgi:UDP-glucose:(heptosyl)LPS alpha-1,3-glucosyltransferase